MIEIFLSSDGKNTLHLQSESTQDLNKDLPYAKQLFKKMLEEYGTKKEQWAPVMGNGKANQLTEEDSNQNPLCSIHQERMVLKTGRFGQFMACPIKVDGEWCRGRPTKA